MDERCQYCLSPDIVLHSEGMSCTSCSRLQASPVFLPAKVCEEEDVGAGLTPLSELQALEDRHLINSETANTSLKLYHELRKLNINFATSTLLVIVIQQSMARHIGAPYSIQQLSSLLDPQLSPNLLMRRHIKLWQNFPKLITFSPYFPTQYVPLHILLKCPKTRRDIFRKSLLLQKKSGFVVDLATCVYVVVKNMKTVCVSEEDLSFVCNFPHINHISHVQTFCPRLNHPKSLSSYV